MFCNKSTIGAANQWLVSLGQSGLQQQQSHNSIKDAPMRWKQQRSSQPEALAWLASLLTPQAPVGPLHEAM